MDALAQITETMPDWSTPLIAAACIMPVLTQVWPMKQALAMSAIARGTKPASTTRPKAFSDGKNKASWGPLTFDGIKGMHYGDLFYAACGLMIYCMSWPDPSVAKEWPALDGTVVHSWVALVLARNLVLEVSFYEFWHQLLFGVFANEAVTQHRYSEGSPYEAKPGAKNPQMSVWRERFWCTCGFICARPSARESLFCVVVRCRYAQADATCVWLDTQGQLLGSASSSKRGRQAGSLRAAPRPISPRDQPEELGL